jgi:hypothetical protein
MIAAAASSANLAIGHNPAIRGQATSKQACPAIISMKTYKYLQVSEFLCEKRSDLGICDKSDMKSC